MADEIDIYSLAAGIALGRHNCVGSGAGGKLSEIVVQSGNATFVEVPAEGFFGIGKVTVIGSENLLEENIRYGVDILGRVGTYAPDPKLMAGTVTITENGVRTVYPSAGYNGLRRLQITTQVPTQLVLQEKSVMPGTSDLYVRPDTSEGYNGLGLVKVAGDPNLRSDIILKGHSIFGVPGAYEKTEIVQAVFQSKAVTPGRYAQTIRPDPGYDGLSSVYVAGDPNLRSEIILEGNSIFNVPGSHSCGTNYQTKTVIPTRAGLTVMADSGYNALLKVIVAGDPNLNPDCIADGKSIFGVPGRYVSPMKAITVLPSLDEQVIYPAEGFYGFNKITVAPAAASGDYNEGFAAGAASRDEEVAGLLAQIAELQAQRDAAYQEGYDAGYAAGVSDLGVIRAESVVYDDATGTCTVTLANGQVHKLTYLYDEDGNVNGMQTSLGDIVRLEGVE